MYSAATGSFAAFTAVFFGPLAALSLVDFFAAFPGPLTVVFFTTAAPTAFATAFGHVEAKLCRLGVEILECDRETFQN